MLDKKVGSSPLVGVVGAPDAAIGKQTLVDQLQRKASGSGDGDPLAAAARGLAAPTTQMPHAAAIQASFGPAHDVSAIQAHVGGPAAEAAEAMGATAFASRNHVAFAAQPDLHTAAHEAAHVVQQAQGVNLYGGVGQAGDAHEQHADAVADRVVAGKSAADLLGPGGQPGAAGAQVQHKLKHNGKDIDDAKQALQVLTALQQQHGRAIDFAQHTSGIAAVMKAPEVYDLLDGKGDLPRNALSSVILAINKHEGVKPGKLYQPRTVGEIMQLINGDSDLAVQRVDDHTFTYRNGGTTRLEAVLRGTDYAQHHKDDPTAPQLFDNQIQKSDDHDTGLKIVSLGPVKLRERAADAPKIDVSSIPKELQDKAQQLEARYRITQTPGWRLHRVEAEFRGTVGEYLTLDDGARVMPLPGGEGQMQQWHSVHFIGDVFASEGAATAEITNTDAGSELDLMNVRKDKDTWHCLGVGNVKIGTGAKLAGNAATQNADALTLIRSFSDARRYQLSNKKWAHVKRITATSSTGAVTVDHGPFVIDSGVQQVTVGAKSAPGNYTANLNYTVEQITSIAHCLQAMGQKGK
jgi:hypothetical protein